MAGPSGILIAGGTTINTGWDGHAGLYRRTAYRFDQCADAVRRMPDGVVDRLEIVGAQHYDHQVERRVHFDHLLNA